METITITFTAAAAKEFKRELTNNGIIYGVCETTYTVENNRKSRMAIQMVKERYGSRSIKVNNSSAIVNNF
jgi:hypothetical protein